MKIDGRLIAQEIKDKLKERVISLKSQHITPHLAVILIGDDPSSITYVRQKEKVGKEIGARITVYRLPENHPGGGRLKRSGSHDSPGVKEPRQTLLQLVQSLNSDPRIHGIIIQRPIPLDIPRTQLDQLVQLEKDVDGFHPKSPFTPPIALAVIRILSHVSKLDQLDKLVQFLRRKKILIIGRGDTGGKPIADIFRKMKISYQLAHSKTTERELKRLCLNSDIIISCVGKRSILRRNMISNKTILIGVGLHPLHPSGGLASHLTGKKLEPDYNQDEIAGKVAFYTPVPGGVGPVNVACLFENFLHATTLQT